MSRFRDFATSREQKGLPSERFPVPTYCPVLGGFVLLKVVQELDQDLLLGALAVQVVRVTINFVNTLRGTEKIYNTLAHPSLSPRFQNPTKTFLDRRASKLVNWYF